LEREGKYSKLEWGLKRRVYKYVNIIVEGERQKERETKKEGILYVNYLF
jgi:hypothetical protein